MEITLPGGINKTVREVAEHLTKLGHECTILMVNDEYLSVSETINGVHILRVNSHISKYLYGFSPAMYSYLVKNIDTKINPDIVHIHGLATLLTPEMAYISQKRNIPIVFSPHYDFERHLTKGGMYLWNFYIPIARYVFKVSNKVLGVSEFEVSKFVETFHVQENKVQIIPHGVDKFTLNKKDMKQDSLSLLYVGYLIEVKGVQYIIQALKELKKCSKEIKLTIVGEGNYKPKLVELAKKLEVYDLIDWRSNLSNEGLYRKYKNADVSLLLSRSEAYGIVVAVALACGTPCIVANTTALKEFTKELGCFGIDYPPDPKELAELIIKIHESNVQVGPFSNKIRTWDKVAEDYEKVYEDCL
jgi:glycosyltransferase involved in cell wall biosynthesis